MPIHIPHLIVTHPRWCRRRYTHNKHQTILVRYIESNILREEPLALHCVHILLNFLNAILIANRSHRSNTPEIHITLHLLSTQYNPGIVSRHNAKCNTMQTVRSEPRLHLCNKHPPMDIQTNVSRWQAQSINQAICLKKHKTIPDKYKQKHNIQSITQVRQWHRRHKTTSNHSIVNTSTSMSISELLNEYTLNIELCNCLRAIPQLSTMSNTQIFGDRGTWYTHADAIPKYTHPHCRNVQNSP